MNQPNSSPSNPRRFVRVALLALFGVVAALSARPLFSGTSSGQQRTADSHSASVGITGGAAEDGAGVSSAGAGVSASSKAAVTSSVPAIPGSIATARSVDPKGYGADFYTTERQPYAQFAGWVKGYEHADAVHRTELVKEGARLAEARHAALQSLIQTDPAAAISLAVPMADRVALPKAIADSFETRVEGVGRLSVKGVLPIPGHALSTPSVIRSIVLDHQEYSAYLPATAANHLTIPQATVEGIAVNQQLAVASVTPTGLAFQGEAYGDPSLGSDATTQKPLPAWTHGQKRVIIIRVDYSDLSGGPILAEDGVTQITPAVAVNLFTQTNGICDFYAQGSYGATSLAITQADVTPVYRMPQTAEYYAQGNGSIPYSGTLQVDATNAAIAGGFDLTQYDRIGVVTSNLAVLSGSKVGFAGVSEIGGKNFLINAYYEFSVVAHEIGHTYGVFHANWWDPEDGSIVGTATDMLYNFFNGAISRVSIEYGDQYDVMGGEGDSVGTGVANYHNHFNPWFKSILGWLPDASVNTVLTSGVYRVYRYDDPNVDLVNHTMALKVNRDILRNYWIGYRRQPYSGSTNINNGAYITYGYFVNRASDLLDCNNPGVNVNNAALNVGESFVDADAGVTITTLDQGGTAPNEYLDIQVTLQPRVGFQTPKVTYEMPVNSTATVLVDRLGGSTGVTTVDYSTVDGTAVAGTNYGGVSGTLTWGDGDNSSRAITIPLLSCPATGGATDFTIQLGNVSNGVLINPSTIDVSLRPAGNPDPAYVADRTDDRVNSVSMTLDGKQFIAGKFTQFGFATAGGYAKTNLDGSRDYTFDSTTGANGEVNVIVQQPDGKALIGGAFTNVNNASPALPYLARVNSDGSTDTGFIPVTLDNRVLCLAVQPDGKIVVGGLFKNVNGQPCIGLCRLNSNGTLDFRFSNSSYGQFDPGGGGGIRTLLLDSYSSAAGVRILAGGDIIQSSGYGITGMGLIRLAPDGSVDSSFNIGLGAHEKGGPGVDQVDSLAMQADGKILVGGTFTAFGNSTQKYLARLNPDGSPDSGFSAGITGTSIVQVASIAAQPDGKIVIGGTFLKVDGAINCNLARVTASGAYDSSWDDGINGANGVTSPVGALLIRPDGRILVGSSLASYYYGTFRGSAPPFDDLSGGIATQTLFSNLTGQYGIAEFASSTGAVKPGNTLTIYVQRVGGNTGAVKVDYCTQPGSAVVGTDYATAQGTITWADGDNAPKPISVSTLAGSTAGRKFIVNLGIPRGGLQLGTPASMIVTLNLNAPAVTTTGSDGSGDGTSGSGSGGTTSGLAAVALMNYALAPIPQSDSSQSYPQVTVAGNHLRIVFNRDPQKMDVTYEVQGSDDLTAWETIASSSGGAATINFDATSVSETPVGTFQQVTVDDSVTIGTTPNRYLRVRLTR